MSFRDLRNFTEIMRVLGYPRLISVGNFRTPIFPLVAEILIWLVKRFDSNADITDEYITEEGRIALTRSVAEFMVLKTNVKLNTKKLYQADGYAVKELLKIAMLLYEAQNNSDNNDIILNDSFGLHNFDISDKVNELKSARQLASQLTVTGASLYDLLGRESDLREIRYFKVTRQFDTTEIETVLKDFIENIRREFVNTKKYIDNVKDTEYNLDVRIERRRMELERNQKRLHSLKKVRPAFMEEFEKLEIELKTLHDNYIQKFCYLAYLEYLYEDATRMEQEKFNRRQERIQKQLEKMRAEDASFESMIEGNDSILPVGIQESSPLFTDTENQSSEKRISSSRLKSVGSCTPRVSMSQRRIYGSMSGRQKGVAQESNDSAGSLDSDSDLLIDGELDDDDEDDDILDSVVGPDIGNFNIKVGQEKHAIGKLDHSDEDF